MVRVMEALVIIVLNYNRPNEDSPNSDNDRPNKGYSKKKFFLRQTTQPSRRCPNSDSNSGWLRSPEGEAQIRILIQIHKVGV